MKFHRGNERSQSHREKRLNSRSYFIAFDAMSKRSVSTSQPKKTVSNADARSVAKSAKHSLQRETKSESSVARKSRKRVDSFSHAIYENASKIFLHLKGVLTSSELPVFEDDLERRRAYSMAFGAKRYEKVLDDVLLDSYFFSSYFKFETKHKHRVMVLLLDYQQSGFFFGNERKRSILNEADIIPDIASIQEALKSHRTKLRAALARSRVRDCAISVEALLPKEEQEKIKYAASQPVYARINSLKTTLDEVLEALMSDGFSPVDKVLDQNDDMTRKTFCKDQHFENLLVFSQEAKFDLHGHNLVNDGHLVIQDKSTVISVEVVRQIVNEFATQKEKVNILLPGADMKAMLGDGDDIIQTHVESGNVTAYLSSIIHPDRKVFAFGATPQTYEGLESKMNRMGAHNVSLLEEHFLDAIPNDERFRKVKIIVVNVPCSKSGIVNPIDYILQEGVSTSIKDLAQGGTDAGKVRGLAFQHLGILKHAMKFPLLQAIVYFTRSISEYENLDVVKKALDEAKDDTTKNGTFELTQALPHLANSLKELVLPANIEAVEITKRKDERYIIMAPSEAMNGGFVVLLKKQKPVETAHEILERAAKKGLMKPAKSKHSSTKIKHVHSDVRVKAHPSPSLPIAKLHISDQTPTVISDTEAEEPKAVKDPKPSRSWHGSDEDLSKKPLKKKDSRNFKF